MKQKIVFILGVLFAANVGYSGSQYNQNARSISYNNGAIKTDNVGNSNGKIKSRTDSYGQVRGDTGGTIKVIDYREEEPIYSKNGDLLYTIQPVGDDGGLIVRMLDGREIELKDGKAVDRWKTNMTILENMESVFGGTDGVCKSGLERGFIVDKNFSMKDMTRVSMEKSVELKTIDYDSKAVIHNHPSLNGESHAWPSLSDMFSAFSTTRQEDYIVDCYDKKIPVRIDSDRGIIYKIDDIGRETVAENLGPNFQNVLAYKELKKELDNVTTMDELTALLERKPPEGMGYKHSYGNMPYVPADFELLKKKFMSLCAAEKNKSGTLQNAFSEVGVGAVKGDIAKTDVDEAKSMGDKCDVIKAIEQLINCMKERNAAIESLSRSRPKRAMNDVNGIISDGNAISAEIAKYTERVEKCIETLNVSFLEMEKEFSNDSTVQINAIREKRYNSIKPHIIELFEILRDSPDKIRHRVEKVIPIHLARYLVNCDNRIRKKYYLLPSFGFEH